MEVRDASRGSRVGMRLTASARIIAEKSRAIDVVARRASRRASAEDPGAVWAGGLLESGGDCIGDGVEGGFGYGLVECGGEAPGVLGVAGGPGDGDCPGCGDLQEKGVFGFRGLAQHGGAGSAGDCGDEAAYENGGEEDAGRYGIGKGGAAAGGTAGEKFGHALGG